MTTTVHLVRHGRVHNPDRIIYGRLPRFGLSERGRADARAAADLLAGEPLVAVYASPLLRARQTARAIVHRHPPLAIRISRLLLEVSTPYEGRPVAEARSVGEDFYTGVGPGFDQPGDVVERMVRFFTRVAQRHPGSSVAAVTHGDPLAFTIQWAADRALEPKTKAALHDTGVSDGYPQPGSITSVDICETGRVRRFRYRCVCSGASTM